MFPTLHRKLLLLVLLSIGGTILSVGIALSLLVSKTYEDNARQEFRDYFDRAAQAFAKSRASVEQSARALGMRPSLVNGLHLISDYADATQYQALVFDEEKKAIGELLHNHAHVAGEQLIRVFDKHGWLVAYTDIDRHSTGILSFQNGKPLLLADNEEQPGFHPAQQKSPGIPVKLDDIPLGTHFLSEAHRVGLQTAIRIYRTLPNGARGVVGTLVIHRYMHAEFLASAAGRFPGSYSILTASGEHLFDEGTTLPEPPLHDVPDLFQAVNARHGDWIPSHHRFIQAYAIATDSGKPFYLIATLDKAFVTQQVHNTLLVIIGIFALSALLLVPFGLWFARRSITGPIDSLVRNADAIREGRYLLPVSSMGSRELDTLALALKSAALEVADRERELHATQDQLEERVAQRTAALQQTNAILLEEIAERRHVETKLRDSRGMLQLVMETIPDYVFWKDVDSTYLGCNANFLRAAGLDKVSDIVGKTDYDMPWASTEADAYRADDREVMDNDRPKFHIEETQVTATGELIHIETNKVPLHDETGQVIGVLGSFANITERRQTQQELLAAKQAAEQASCAKSEFLSRMSHELRTPLNAILGFSQLLEVEAEKRLTLQDRDNINEISQAGQHLLELISEILDLSRIEVGSLQLNIQDVDVAALTKDCIALTKGLADARDVRVTSEQCRCHNPVVRADPMRLRQILLNLISNAIKYNRNHGSVTLLCENLGGTVRFEVRDTGIGIPADRLHRVFEPFDRLDADKLGIDGTGIGLVIVRELLTLMGGEIGLHSEPGQGSNFWFTLPTSPTTAAPAEAGPEVQDALPEAPAQGVAVAAVHDMPPIQVLYVEDNPANYRLVERALQRRPRLRLQHAATAQEGITMARAQRPQLILMDIQLPGMDGNEALQQLRADPDTAAIPVIALSANAMAEDIAHSLSVGFAAYLTKPLDLEKLYRTIDQQLGDQGQNAPAD